MNDRVLSFETDNSCIEISSNNMDTTKNFTISLPTKHSASIAILPTDQSFFRPLLQLLLLQRALQSL